MRFPLRASLAVVLLASTAAPALAQDSGAATLTGERLAELDAAQWYVAVVMSAEPGGDDPGAAHPLRRGGPGLTSAGADPVRPPVEGGIGRETGDPPAALAPERRVAAAER